MTSRLLPFLHHCYWASGTGDGGRDRNLPCLLQESTVCPGAAAAVGPHNLHNIHSELCRCASLHDVNQLSRPQARMIYVLGAMQ